MLTQTREARELCSNSEWELVESSFYPLVETLPASDLKSRLDRARKLYRKTLDLITLQHSDSRQRTTRRKTEMFARVVDRFEATLNLVENDQIVETAPKNVHNKKLAEETQTRNMDALEERADQEFKNRKDRILAAQAVHGEQQGQKSGARHIQSHVGSVYRRQQGRRDTKNR